MSGQPTGSLDALFHPTRVAVVGASERPGTVGALLMRNLAAFPGEVIPISTSQATVEGTPTLPSLAAITEHVELAIVAVPATAVPDVVADAAAAGVGALVVLAGGFAETGPEGATLQRRTVEAARAGGVRLIGPNCFGVQNPNTRLNASIATGMPPPGGDLALATQSGAYGMAIATLGAEEQLRFSKVYAAGNKADVSDAEVLAYLGADDDTAVLCFFLESVSDGRAFIDTARLITPAKPVLVTKTGRTASGARAAVSHTASLAGRADVWSEVLTHTGVTVVPSAAEMLDAAKVIDWQPAPAGGRVGVVTNSGGVGVELTDLLTEEGLDVPELSSGLREDLAARLPAFGSARNPVDITPDWPRFAELYAGCLDALARSGEVDAVVLALVQRAALDEQVAAAVTATASRLRTERPGVAVTVCWLAARDAQPQVDVLQAAGVPSFPSPDRTARALAHSVRSASARLRARQPPPWPSPPEDLPALPDGLLGPERAARLARAFGIDVADQAVCADVAEAVAAAGGLGYPVVAKLASGEVVHKSDVGGVRTALASEADLRAAVADLQAIDPTAAVLVQPHVAGVEMLVGGYHDAELGPVVAVGVGGLFAEVLADVAFRLAPLDAHDGRAAVESLAGFELLTGARGRPPANVAALAATVAATSRLLAALPDVAEVDCNPVLVSPAGAVAVDLRIVIDHRTQTG